jgi:hypothetical protein
MVPLYEMAVSNMGFAVAWDPFEAGLATAGGLIIAGVSSFAFMGYGRITGLSGIFYSNISGNCFNAASLWRLGFLFGLILAAILPTVFLPDGLPLAGHVILFFDPISALETRLPMHTALVAGLLVGVGTFLGSGCTSGHGVCGLPRLAPRSFIAVFTFMATGVIAATALYSAAPATPLQADESGVNLSYSACMVFAVGLLLFKVTALYQFTTSPWVALDMLVGCGMGLVFGFGLLLSGMARQSKVLGFLTLSDHWDPSLAFVMFGAVCFNLITFQYTLSLGKSLTGRPLPAFPSMIDWKVVVGPAVFGLGWGLSGLCPGPAIMNLFRSDHVMVFVAALACGQFLANFLLHFKAAKTKAS